MSNNTFAEQHQPAYYAANIIRAIAAAIQIGIGYFWAMGQLNEAYHNILYLQIGIVVTFALIQAAQGNIFNSFVFEFQSGKRKPFAIILFGMFVLLLGSSLLIEWSGFTAYQNDQTDNKVQNEIAQETSSIAADYDAKINAINREVETIFKQNNYRGKISENSLAAADMSALRQKAMDLATQRDEAIKAAKESILAKYDTPETIAQRSRNTSGILTLIVLICIVFSAYYKSECDKERNEAQALLQKGKDESAAQVNSENSVTATCNEQNSPVQTCSDEAKVNDDAQKFTTPMTIVYGGGENKQPPSNNYTTTNTDEQQPPQQQQDPKKDRRKKSRLTDEEVIREFDLGKTKEEIANEANITVRSVERKLKEGRKGLNREDETAA
jgi:hypothetical protein